MFISPLHLACINNHIDAVKLLLSNGADIDKQDEDGWTPLHYTADADNDHYEMCEYLIDQGANMNLVNIDGNYAYDLADVAISKLLIRSGFDLKNEYLERYDGDYSDIVRMLVETIESFAEGW